MGKQWKQWETIFLASKITVDDDCSHGIKRRLFFGRKAMTNLDSVLKSRDITLPTKFCLVKAMVFPVITYECEKNTQSCPTPCDPMDYKVHGILHASMLEWLAFPFPRGSSQLRDQTQVSCIAGRFFISQVTSWTKKLKI